MPRHSFQFTPLREGRPAAPCFAVVIVSDFNSRPSARGDAIEFVEGYQVIYFNSRPSARGDCPCSSHTAHSVRYFNSRPSARGDRQHEAKYAYRRYFNSRPSARGDIPHGAPALQPRYFNSRPSARGDRLCTSHKRQLFYFNSRPSARGDDTPAPRPGSRAISIHAPPRGATIHPRHVLDPEQFQFTPLREGRRQRPATPPWE